MPRRHVLLLTLAAVLALPGGTAAQARPAYTLRAGDVVKLQVWREPELSKEYRVDGDGRVAFPLAGSIDVSRMSRDALQARLHQAYDTKIEDLAMDVVVLRRVPIVGAVRVPGLYPMELDQTVGDALAMAGGATTDMRRMRVSLLRRGAVIDQDVNLATPVGELPLEPGDQLFVPGPDGFFSRNPWALGTLIQSAVTITTILLTR